MASDRTRPGLWDNGATMKICIVGAGAIGGMLAVRLGAAGHALTLILRGANLAAVQADGMTLIDDRGVATLLRPVLASADIAVAGPQDLVILALKAHQLGAVAGALQPLLHAQTRVVTMQNGIPFWYFHKLPGPFQGRVIETVDPGGEIARSIGLDRVLGSVVYPACELLRPGVIRVIEGNRFSLGELDGSDGPDIRAISDAFKAAGLKAPISRDIRSEIWLKLWGNLSFNPISALTHATLEGICRFGPTRELAAGMMREAQAIGHKLGVRFKVSLEQRIDGAQAVGRHKTSMLQDVERGRAIELQALVGSVLELGRITGTPTPLIGAVHALASLLADTLQQHPGGMRLADTTPEP